ncbi:helix-turn-helix domain-containing protein [Ursidibacter sp. B-7004-1]
MDEIIKAFGKAIRQRRKQQELTQEQLGFEADIQRIYVSKLELGQQQPSLTTIFKLAHGLNCSASTLIKETETILNDKPK